MTLKFDTRSSIAIWGYGLEGRAAYKYFQDLGVTDLCYIVQDLPDASERDAAFILETELETIAARKNFDLIVKSPGVSKYKASVKYLQNKGIPLTSGTNLWFADNPDAKTIIVTGTKGKTTVSSLIHHILLKNKYRSRLAGNIGRPLVETPPGEDVTVIELSSYQTADFEFAADIAVVTNLFEDHLDWHLGVKTYHADKLRVFSRTDQTIGLTTPQVAAQYSLPGNVTLSKAEGYAFTPSGDVMKQGRKIGAGFRLKGAHNERNFILAYDAACRFAGSEMLDEIVDFSTFEPLPHRLSETYIGHDILLVDDSISTIPEAAISAMDVYGVNTHILIGGYDRHISYAKLIDYLGARPLKSVSLFGPVGKRLWPELKDHDQDVLYSDNLSQALTKLIPRVTAGDRVVLSPAAPSYDEFENFKARGRFFIKKMTEGLR